MLIRAGPGSKEPHSLPHEQEAGQLNLGNFSHWKQSQDGSGGNASPAPSRGTQASLSRGDKPHLSTGGQCEHGTCRPHLTDKGQRLPAPTPIPRKSADVGFTLNVIIQVCMADIKILGDKTFQVRQGGTPGTRCPQPGCPPLSTLPWVPEPALRSYLTQKCKEPMFFSEDGTQFINACPGTQKLNPLPKINSHCHS